MRLAVLGSANGWHERDLSRAAADRHEIIPLAFHEVRSHLQGDRSSVCAGKIDLRTVDGVLVRTMPQGTLEQIVFRMDALLRLEAMGQMVVNPPRAVEAAVDKFLASAKLQAAGLPTPPTAVCQTVDDALCAFEALGGDIVCKPLFGAEGRGITRITDEELLIRAVKMLADLGAVIYLQRFIPHGGYDLRVLVIGRRTLAMRRSNPRDWRTNVSRGATTEAVVLAEEHDELARRAAAAIGAPLAGVDLLVGEDGTPYVIEVNAVPGWKAMSRTLGVDVASEILDFLDAAVNR